MPPTDFDRQEREVEFTRALSFSDGVFAFAITLLVTTIDMPNLSGGDSDDAFLQQLDDLAPFFASYFLSFAVVGLLWLRHHRLFSRIHLLDQRALVINLVLLSFVVLMPFSTEVMARYGDLALGVSTYALNLAIAGGAYTWLWWYCARAGMLGHESPDEMRIELGTRLSISGGFLLSIPIAFVDTRAAQFSWILIVVGQRMLIRRYATAGQPRAVDR
jgi:uncharacterized membrane protein